MFRESIMSSFLERGTDKCNGRDTRWGPFIEIYSSSDNREGIKLSLEHDGYINRREDHLLLNLYYFKNGKSSPFRGNVLLILDGAQEIALEPTAEDPIRNEYPITKKALRDVCDAQSVAIELVEQDKKKRFGGSLFKDYARAFYCSLYDESSFNGSLSKFPVEEDRSKFRARIQAVAVWSGVVALIVLVCVSLFICLGESLMDYDAYNYKTAVSNYNKIKVGMTIDEVKKICGKPSRIYEDRVINDEIDFHYWPSKDCPSERQVCITFDRKTLTVKWFH